MTTTKAKLFKTAVVAVEGTVFPKGTIVGIRYVGAVAGKNLFEATFKPRRWFEKPVEHYLFEGELEGFVL